jgi:5-methylcytosine-specific restriction endonuclease McrA
MLRDQVLATENKVYKSRNFPPSVRAMIFARDGFCCQACGRSRDQLIREGSHLQVDHKVAWGDGGQTCYSNGETLCRECNHAKHTTKKFWHAKEALWGRRE